MIISAFKKRIVLSAVAAALLCAVLLLSGCESDFFGGYNSLVHSMEPKSSVAEINEELDVNLKTPSGILFPEYYVIRMSENVHVGQVSFRYGGKEYLFRAGRTQGDISGMWVNGAALGTTIDPAQEYEAQVLPDGTMWSRWYVGDVQYFLSCQNGIEERFKQLEKSLR